MFSRLAAKQQDKSQLIRPPICCVVVKQIHTGMSDPSAFFPLAGKTAGRGKALWRLFTIIQIKDAGNK